jgi:hypothetical protein
MRPVHYRDYNSQPPLNLPTDCDRCGRRCPQEDLFDDGLGMVGPCCRIHAEAIHG